MTGLEQIVRKEMPEAWKSNPTLQQHAIHHQAWLQQIQTQEVIGFLMKRKHSLISRICSSTVTSSTDDRSIRMMTMQLAEVDNLLSVMTNTEKFVEQHQK